MEIYMYVRYCFESCEYCSLRVYTHIRVNTCTSGHALVYACSPWCDVWRLQLSMCNDPMHELSNPGASGSIFYITEDDEFIVKTVQHSEADFLQKLLPGYYMVSTHAHTSESSLATASQAQKQSFSCFATLVLLCMCTMCTLVHVHNVCMSCTWTRNLFSMSSSNSCSICITKYFCVITRLPVPHAAFLPITEAIVLINTAVKCQYHSFCTINSCGHVQLLWNFATLFSAVLQYADG